MPYWLSQGVVDGGAGRANSEVHEPIPVTSAHPPVQHRGDTQQPQRGAPHEHSRHREDWNLELVSATCVLALRLGHLHICPVLCCKRVSRCGLGARPEPSWWPSPSHLPPEGYQPTLIPNLTQGNGEGIRAYLGNLSVSRPSV